MTRPAPAPEVTVHVNVESDEGQMRLMLTATHAATERFLSMVASRPGVTKVTLAPPTPADPAAPDPATLTRRERQVALLIVEGLSNRQIARRLEISEKTVKTHLTNVFARLGFMDRTQLAVWALRVGLAE